MRRKDVIGLAVATVAAGTVVGFPLLNRYTSTRRDNAVQAFKEKAARVLPDPTSPVQPSPQPTVENASPDAIPKSSLREQYGAFDLLIHERLGPAPRDAEELGVNTFSSDLTEEQWELLRAFLAENEDLLDELRRLVARGGPVGWADMPDPGFTLADQRRWVRLLLLNSRVCAHFDDPETAVNDCLAVLQLGSVFGAKPSGFEHAVRVHLQGMGIAGLAENIPPDKLTGEQRRLIIERAAECYEREAFVDGITVEGLSVSGLIDGMRDGTTKVTAADGTSDFLFSRVWGPLCRTPIADPLLDSDQERAARLSSVAVDIASLPYYEAMPLLEEFESRQGPPRPWQPFSLWHADSMAGALERQALIETELDLLRIGMAVEQFHADHGAYPESLDEVTAILGESIPVDPCTGDPYRYINHGDSFQLYGLGWDREDDGGRHDPRHSGDIAWRAPYEPIPPSEEL